jgi:nitrilase
MTMQQTVRVAAVQAESRVLDLAAGVDKVVALIGEAAAGGAQLVAFPETFLPGYPWWIWLDSPAAGMQFVPRYMANSMTREAAEMDRIQQAAAEYGTHVVLGFSERAGGSLYIAQATISDTGELIGVRRKLKPTHVERTVFGEGDGSDLQVHDTSLGRVGALNCWEHLQPLTKYAMYSQGEEIHVASWPSFSGYRGLANALGPGGEHRSQLDLRSGGTDLRCRSVRGHRCRHPRDILRQRPEASAVATWRRIRPDLRS